MIRKIGYVCINNPFEDRRAWSGTVFKIRESIENAGFEVVWIPERPTGLFYKLCKLAFKVITLNSNVESIDGLLKLRSNNIDRSKTANVMLSFS